MLFQFWNEMCQFCYELFGKCEGCLQRKLMWTERLGRKLWISSHVNTLFKSVICQLCAFNSASELNHKMSMQFSLIETLMRDDRKRVFDIKKQHNYFFLSCCIDVLNCNFTDVRLFYVGLLVVASLNEHLKTIFCNTFNLRSIKLPMEKFVTGIPCLYTFLSHSDSLPNTLPVVAVSCFQFPKNGCKK